MTEADVTVQVNAPQDKVWKIISDIDNDPRYWNEILEIRILSRERNTVTREVKMYDGSTFLQKVILFPKEGVHIRWTIGRNTGIRDIMLTGNGSSTIVRIQTSYKSHPQAHAQRDSLARMQEEAEVAIALIKRDAESGQRRVAGESSNPGIRPSHL